MNPALATIVLSSAALFTHSLDKRQAAFVDAWVASQPGSRLAVDADSRCLDEIESVRRGTPGTPWGPVPDFHPYQVVADFNADGSKDLAIALVRDTDKGKQFELVVFNGPLRKGARPAFRDGVGNLACGGLFFGPPRPEPHRLLVGPFESDSTSMLVPEAGAYRWNVPGE
jgi:hypothetical protein